MNPTEKHLVIPVGYQTKRNVRETEIAIKLVKDQVEAQIADTLNLTRVSAPLYVRPETGLNDNLSGVERPVSFDINPSTLGLVVQSWQSGKGWPYCATDFSWARYLCRYERHPSG